MKLFHRQASLAAWKVGFLQTAIVVTYILMGALFVTSPFAEALKDGIFQWFPPVGILAFLTTFVFSALFCATAILGYPVLLCFEKEYRRCMQIVLWSIAWLALFLLGIALVAAINLGVQA